MSEVQQITKANFIRLGVAAFKEHELREIVATFCKLPGIAPLAASQGSAGGERGGVRSEDTAKVAADLQELMDVIEAVRGERGLLRVSGTRGDPNDVGVLGIERFNDLMIRAIDALAIPTLAQAAPDPFMEDYKRDTIADLIEHCASIAEAIDSGRGNEKEIAKAIRALAHPSAQSNSPTIDNVPSCGQENDFRRGGK